MLFNYIDICDDCLRVSRIRFRMHTSKCTCVLRLLISSRLLADHKSTRVWSPFSMEVDVNRFKQCWLLLTRTLLQYFLSWRVCTGISFSQTIIYWLQIFGNQTLWNIWLLLNLSFLSLGHINCSCMAKELSLRFLTLLTINWDSVGIWVFLQVDHDWSILQFV